MQENIRYCDHFKNLKIATNLQIQKNPSCKLCFLSKTNLWLCLAKGCSSYFCDANKYQHMLTHLEDSRSKKSFHSSFINICTATIFCVYCKIEIYDLDRIAKSQSLQDPFLIRIKVLPNLQQYTKCKITGQLQTPQGHRKYNRGMTGLFSSKYNHLINSTIQFIAHCSYLKQLILQMKVDHSNKLLYELRELIKNLESCQFRALKSEQFSKQILKIKPQLYSYFRKDPFDLLMFLISTLHEELKFYSSFQTTNKFHLQNSSFERDEWDLLSKSKDVLMLSPIQEMTSLIISLNYKCEKCEKKECVMHKLDILKLHFPKKRKKMREVQKDLEQHRFNSPIKNRKKSLINFILPADPQCPFTIPELIIEFLKLPLHKQKLCSKCGYSLKKQKIHFEKLPQVLIIQISRMQRDGASINEQFLEPQVKTLDLGPFSSNKQDIILYEFQSSICFEKKCLYPVMVRNQMNKQLYSIRDQLLQLIRQPKNPYILCYRKKVNKDVVDLYHNIYSSIETKVKLDYSLPDFWLLQLKYGRQTSMIHQLVCRHNMIKGFIKSKMNVQQSIPFEIYEALVEKFGGSTYVNTICKICEYQTQLIKTRRQKQRQTIVCYDKLKTDVNCMICSKWLKNWSDFLYKKGQYAYLTKGYPLPGIIDNKGLLENGKCKFNLKKNENYKIINIFVWKFLKQLYGGGPQIRYKSKSDAISSQDQQKILQVKEKASQIKSIYVLQSIDSPMKKSLIIEKTTSFVQSINGQQEDLPSP